MLLGRSSIGPEMTVYANESFLNGQPSSKNPYSTKKKRVLKSRRALRIALLTREPNNYTSKRIVIAGQQKRSSLNLSTLQDVILMLILATLK